MSKTKQTIQKVRSYNLTSKEVLKTLKTNPDTGLTSSQVSKLREEYGSNELESADKKSLLWMFFKQFNNFLIYILLIAAGIAFVFDHKIDTYVILFVVVVNAIIGFIQEYKAQKSMEALQNMVKPKATVLRNGEVLILPASELVPGDILKLEEGDKIPADGRIIKQSNFMAVESSLTGESYPVEKQVDPLEGELPLADQINMVFMGTFASSGSALVVVTETGQATALGQIADSLNSVKQQKTKFQEESDKLSHQVAICAILASSFIFITGYFFRQMPIVEIFLFTLASLVSGIPEGLPAVMAIVLAIGARRMAQKNAIIRELSATESLGSVTTICTDKTGTLTQNKMSSDKLILLNSKTKKDLFEIDITGTGLELEGDFIYNSEKLDLNWDKNNSSQKQILADLYNFAVASKLGNRASVKQKDGQNQAVGDPTEVAVQVLGIKAKIKDDELKLLEDFPFSSEYKCRASLLQDKDKKSRLVVTGAPEVLLQKLSKEYDQKLIQKINNELEKVNQQGKRTLAICQKLAHSKAEVDLENLQDLDFLGFVSIEDPIRPGVPEAIKKAQQAGIRVLMLTGDHKTTALAIAHQAGIVSGDDKNCYTEYELAKFDDEKLGEILKNTSVFARVNPNTKLRITKILQSQNQVVAMTGDGVNDAPALKQADVGVAMGQNGTDVARDSADIVLADDNFVSIVDAIEQGRIVFNNVRRSSFYLLSSTFSETATILMTMVLGWGIPLVASQVLWMNLVTDGVNGIALATESVKGDELKSKPRSKTEGILNKKMIPYLVTITVWITVIALLSFAYFKNNYGEVEGRTAVLVIISLSQIFNMLSLRFMHKSTILSGIFSNKVVNYGILATLSLVLIGVYFPPVSFALQQTALSPVNFAILFLISSSTLLVGEGFKGVKHGL